MKNNLNKHSEGWELYEKISRSLDGKGGERNNLLLKLSHAAIKILKTIRNDEIENFQEFDFYSNNKFLGTEYERVEDNSFEGKGVVFDVAFREQ